MMNIYDNNYYQRIFYMLVAVESNYDHARR